MNEFPRAIFEDHGERKIRSFVRRQGRMSEAKWKRFHDLGNLHCIDFQPQTTDLSSCFPNKQPLMLEVGFGMGHATAEIAAQHPETNYLGVEVHTPGVAALLDRIQQGKLENVKIIQHDVVEVLDYMILPETFDGVHIFFPDPWPKKRHFKRRLIQKVFLEKLLPKIRPGGYIYMVTDWEDYAQWMLQEISKVPDLTNSYGGYADAQPWRPTTAFERKGLDKQHKIREILVRKRV